MGFFWNSNDGGKIKRNEMKKFIKIFPMKRWKNILENTKNKKGNIHEKKILSEKRFLDENYSKNKPRKSFIRNGKNTVKIINSDFSRFKLFSE